MKINKKTIVQGFMIFKSVYQEFERKMQDEEKGKETIQIWQEIFKTIDFDYEWANDDFITAIKKIITKSKYMPTIAEIIEEMKHINDKRIKKEQKEKLWDMLKIEEKCKLKNANIDKALNRYLILSNNYGNIKIIEMINKYRDKNKINKNMILTTENIFEKIME